MNVYPQHFCLSSGSGRSSFELVAFDNALIDAGISNYNLLKVSSILPIGCEEEDKIDLKLGSPLFTAFAKISSNTPGTKLATAVAVGVPQSKKDIGVIMEYEGEGITSAEAEEMAISMVTESMHNHGIEIKEILTTSTEEVVEEGYLSLISALAMW